LEKEKYIFTIEEVININEFNNKIDVSLLSLQHLSYILLYTALASKHLLRSEQRSISITKHIRLIRVIDWGGEQFAQIARVFIHLIIHLSASLLISLNSLLYYAVFQEE